MGNNTYQITLALIEAANSLKEVFRDTDIVGRHAKDEFTAIAIESFDANNEIIITRLQDELNSRNKQENRLNELSLSIGTAYYDTEELCSVEGLINRAEESMYEQRKNKMES